MKHYPNWGPPPNYGWGYPPPPQPQPMYMPVPTTESEIDKAIKLMKQLRKEDNKKKAKESPKSPEAKKEHKLSYLECVAITVMASPLVMLVYGGIIFAVAKGIRNMMG